MAGYLKWNVKKTNNNNKTKKKKKKKKEKKKKDSYQFLNEILMLHFFSNIYLKSDLLTPNMRRS